MLYYNAVHVHAHGALMMHTCGMHVCHDGWSLQGVVTIQFDSIEFYIHVPGLARPIGWHCPCPHIAKTKLNCWQLCNNTCQEKLQPNSKGAGGLCRTMLSHWWLWTNNLMNTVTGAIDPFNWIFNQPMQLIKLAVFVRNQSNSNYSNFVHLFRQGFPWRGTIGSENLLYQVESTLIKGQITRDCTGKKKKKNASTLWFAAWLTGD